jgi:hypothetical protein
MAGALESTILYVSVAICAVVFAIGSAFFVRAGILGERMSRRANAMVPRALLAQLHSAQLDAKRASKTFNEIVKLAPRAVIASASIAQSIIAYRALLARLRGLA